jgi:Zn-dependent membrane protease YugP
VTTDLDTFKLVLGMFYPYGFGLGSGWLFYIGIPLIIGIWAQIRVTSAFHKWGEVRASSNITGAECAREILQAAQIPDVEVVETNDFLGETRSYTSPPVFTTRLR